MWSQGGLGAEPAWMWSGAADLMFPVPFPRLSPRPEGVFTFSPYSPSCFVIHRIRLVILEENTARSMRRKKQSL